MICPRRTLLFVMGIVMTLAVMCVPAFAQVATGIQPFGSSGGGPDVINLGNLNVHYTIPVRHKVGRGNNFAWDLTYDSTIWTPVGSVGSQAWNLSTLGWTGLSPAGQTYVTYSVTYNSGNCGYMGQSNYQVWNYSNFVYIDQFGAQTNFNDGISYYNSPGGSSCPPNGPQPPTTYPSPAGGYTLYATPGAGTVSGYIVDKSGSKFSPPFGTSPPPPQNPTIYSIDHNSNSITANNGVYTDTMNQTVLSVVQATNTNLFYTAPSGATANYAVSYKSYILRTNFGCSHITEYNTARTASANLVDRVTLPDGSFYQFNYETTYQDNHTPHDVTGRIASVTLPTGGTISYLYATGGTGANGISCADGTATTLVRSTPDTGSNSWTYARALVSGTHWQTTVTDPTSGQNQTLIDFQQDGTANGYFYPTQIKHYSGSTSSGTLLSTVATCYNNNTSNCLTTAVSWPISQQNVTTILGNTNWQSLRVTSFNANGLLTEEDNYDYANGTPTTILKKTLVTYAPLSTIADKPATVTICTGTGTSSSCGGTGTVVSQTTYTYDQGTLTPSSGTPQHNCASNGCSGNLTTVARLVQGSTTLNNTYTYYDTGMLNTSKDVNGAVTTYNYHDSTSTCGNTFPTSVSEPLGLSKSTTWNCSGAVATQVTDENGKNTTSSYSDPYFWRPDSVSDLTGAVTTLTYAASSPYTWTESKLSFNGGNSVVDALTTFDGLGRVHLSQRRQGPTSANYDTIETDYDSLGRIARVTLPYSGTSGQTNSNAPGKTTTYDALGRTSVVTDGGGGTTTSSYAQNDISITKTPAPTGENAKSRQWEYDGLGRLTSVCEVTGGSTAWPGGTCAQNSSRIGYWTKYTYDVLGDTLAVTQNAQAAVGNQQTRTYTYDALGRLTSEKNPETSQVPVTYTFDLDSNCSSTSAGDLVKRVDPVGNVTCFVYDGLHRVTSVTYPSGTYATRTPAKTFVYDVATVNGSPMLNANGRLAEAFTGPAGSKITDLGLSYTARGEVSDVYELTPHSNSTYYHVSQSYWPNGEPYQLISGISGLPTISYGGTIGSTVGLDGEGRITQVTASGTGQQNPVTGVTYNVAGLPTLVTLGSGDSDALTYDPNSYRLTQFKFNVGTSSQSLTGTLTWNANATLGQLAIADQFHSVDTQTCTYSHDDLIRIASANCGAAAAQTFSYDPFGNMDKSGSPYSFQPTYSSATNRMTSLPGNFTPTYDANGNVTNDSNHVYSWDSDGNSNAIDSVGLTFDALGRMVEQNRSGTYTEIVYGPKGGKLALMGGTGGQTLQKAFVPLPGKASAIYVSSGLDHYRHSDWLGSARLTSTPSRTVASTVAYAPFGESYAQSGTADPSFTGQNQDTVSGDYDFVAREYSIEGRWPSPDPGGRAVVDASNPQSWNRFSYVLNNPLAAVDPLGYECVWDDGSFDAEDDPSTGSVSTCQNAGGTWIELGQMGGWSGTANPYLGQLVQDIQSGLILSVTITGVNGSVFGTGFNANGTVSWTDYDGWVSEYAYDITHPAGFVTGGFADPNGQWIGWQNKLNQAIGALFPVYVNPDDIMTILLQQGLNDTGVQALSNPCTIGSFYFASASYNVKLPEVGIVSMINTALGYAGYDSKGLVERNIQSTCGRFN